MVVIDDFYIISVSVIPTEAQPPLVVDSNAVLAPAISRKLLQVIPRKS
jgi:hypothetical protein